MNNNTSTENWTPKQWAAYEALKASMNAPRTISFGKAPKNGWTDTDRVPQVKR